MLRLKSCPRCQGDLVLDSDYYGWYEQCLQCGYMRDMEKLAEVSPQQNYRERAKAVARQGKPNSKAR